MKKIYLLFTVLVTLFAVSCGPSVEGETESWENNKKELLKIKSEYPFYGTMIDAKIAEAEQIWKSSESISDKDQKAEKMQQANDILESGCMGNLKNMKTKVADVEKKIKDVATKQTTATKEKEFADDRINFSRRCIKTAQDVFIAEKSCEQIQVAFTDLQTAISDLDRAITRMTDNKKENVSGADSTKTQNTTPAEVKCEYCETSNPGDAIRCASCGAQLVKK